MTIEERFALVRLVPFDAWVARLRKLAFLAQIMARFSHHRRGRNWRAFEFVGPE